MIDIRRVRDDPDGAKRELGRRGVAAAEVDRVVELDVRHRAVVHQRDEKRREVNRLSGEVAQARRAGDVPKAEALAAQSRAFGDKERQIAGEAEGIEIELRQALLVLPNFPADDCPDGASPDDNVVRRTEGYDAGRYGEDQRVPHWEVGATLGILDLERGAKLSGSMFPMYRGLGASLVRALCQLALDRNADAFEEIRPPTLVRTETMVSTGHLPKFEEDAYHLERDDLWAIPTAEVPLTSLARDEILDESALPMRMMAYTSCYRREAGSAGRDTRGLLRVHEFDKVELLAYATPQQATALHAELLARAEGLLQALGLAYRVMDLCTGDLGISAARTYDLEAYAPGCDQWLEVSSVSWFSDYQARRANVRYRQADGSIAPVHTLNGSALAVPRVWAALVESNRLPDGSVRIPEVLRPYMRSAEVIAPA